MDVDRMARGVVMVIEGVHRMGDRVELWLWSGPMEQGVVVAVVGGEGVGVGAGMVILSIAKMKINNFLLLIWVWFSLVVASVNLLGAVWVIHLAGEHVCGCFLVSCR
jgi:hypothetical protein